MDDHQFDKMLERLMRQDLSVGTETFRDSLLERCLAILGREEEMEIADEYLDLLSAAGDPYYNLTDETE